MREVLHTRQITPIGCQFKHLLFPVIIIYFETGPQSVPVEAVAPQVDLEIVLGRISFPGKVAKDHRLVVDIVHDQVEVAVPIEVGIDRAVGKGRGHQSPFAETSEKCSPSSLR